MCMYACKRVFARMYVCMYVCMYVRMYIRMYGCVLDTYKSLGIQDFAKHIPNTVDCSHT